jgi:hypothetical protein
MTHLLEYMRTHQIDPTIPEDVKTRLLTPFNWMLDYNLNAAADPDRQHFQRTEKCRTQNLSKYLQNAGKRWEKKASF